MSKGSLRTDMPKTAALIDELRQYFGKENIDDVLRRAMRGEPGCFYSEENGHTFGTKETRRFVRIGRDAGGNSVDLDNPGAAKEKGRSGGRPVWELNDRHN